MNVLSSIVKIIVAATLFALAVGVSFAAETDDLYRELVRLDKSVKITRKAYTTTADRFYQIYSSNPSARRADEALLGAARAYRRSYERFKVTEDIDKSLSYYRILQSSFDSAAAKDAYIEAADVFKSRRDTASVKFTLNKLIKKYPDSSHAKVAAVKLSELNGSYTPPKASPEPPKTAAVKKDNGKPPEKQPDPDDDNSAATVSSVSSPADNGGNVVIKGVRYFSDKDYTRVVIDMSGSAGYESHWLRADPTINKPSRLSIDINSSEIEKNIPLTVNIKDGLLSSVRMGYHAADKRTRIVLDSENVKDFTVFQMPNPSRIVVDVYSEDRGFSGTSGGGVTQSAGVVATAPKTQQQAPRQPQGAKDMSDMTLGAALGLKIKTIVIDPGHGGKDPGAVANGVMEKDIVLDISKQLRNMLKRDKSLNVHMTRDDDRFIPLEERTAIANKYKADIFISVHANAASNKQAFGMETYVFNVTNDRAALEVAALENQATTKSISDLQGILKDILKYSKLEESLSLAGSVQKRMVASSRSTKNLGVKQAPFYVLVGATMPSILVELGFISNVDEAQKLKTAQYRKELAQGIYNGLNDYISKYNK